jgi:hypothetical protein
MKHVKAKSDWFGNSPVVGLHGDDRDPLPLPGERVVLTGGVVVVVRRLGQIRTRRDGYRGVRCWEVDSEVDKVQPVG